MSGFLNTVSSIARGAAEALVGYERATVHLEMQQMSYVGGDVVRGTSMTSRRTIPGVRGEAAVLDSS